MKKLFLVLVIPLLMGVGCTKSIVKCDDYYYNTCPNECVKMCVSSSCTDFGLCTSDCGGPGSCVAP